MSEDEICLNFITPAIEKSGFKEGENLKIDAKKTKLF